MSMKTYGIYILYPPNVDLRFEGLGRQLAMFLKGADTLENTKFVIACPSWSVNGVKTLLSSEMVSSNCYEILSPVNMPYILLIYDFMSRYFKKKSKKNYLIWIKKCFFKIIDDNFEKLINKFILVNSPVGLALFLIELLLRFLVIIPLLGAGLIYKFVLFILSLLLKPIKLFLAKISIYKSIIVDKFFSYILRPQDDNWILSLYSKLVENEALKIKSLIMKRSEILCWYSPTAFWPLFNRLPVPKIVCVPDVLLSEFPADFALIGGERFHRTFNDIRSVIDETKSFITYSNYVKWNILVDKFSVPHDHIRVVPHAPSLLNSYVDISGFPNNDEASVTYCRTLLRGVFQKSSFPVYTSNFLNLEVRYIFFASQFRPNKNIITLLKAYEYILRQRFLSYKLILTGLLSNMPEIEEFIRFHNLQHDVIIVHGLTITELAACYKLATLVVNPTLSEGACPFSFTEALSVDTPIIMSAIDVTNEIIINDSVRDLTYFDPYDWRDCANKIEWALNNSGELLSIQKELYNNLTQRTWSNVVDEYIDCFDNVAQNYSAGH